MREKSVYVGKRLLAFAGIYALAAVVMEGIFILLFSIQGYRLLEGDLPQGEIISLLPLYGFVGFAIVAILYVKLVEKETLNTMKISFHKKALLSYVIAILAGIVMLSMVIGLLLLFGLYRWEGMNLFPVQTVLVYFFAYLIQGTAEEIMCRGYLQNILARKTSQKTAIFWSAVVFLIPHLSTIVECDFIIAVISIANVMLVSILFSLSMIKWNSMWVPAGIHAGWNFALAFLWGLNLSGTEIKTGVIRCATVNCAGWLNGGDYGVEASLILTVILLIMDIVMWKKVKE